MIPFSGVNPETEIELESFNFWHSQIRITIERCFGVFIRRWGIFQKPNRYDLLFFFEIVHACARLHNLCINWRVGLIEGISLVDDFGRLKESRWNVRDREHAISGEGLQNSVQVGSTLRDHLVEKIKHDSSLHIVRSHHRQ